MSIEQQLKDAVDGIRGLINQQADLHKQALTLKADGQAVSDIQTKLEQMGKDCEKWSNSYNELRTEFDAEKTKNLELEQKHKELATELKGRDLNQRKDVDLSFGERFTEAPESKEYLEKNLGEIRGTVCRVPFFGEPLLQRKDLVTESQGTTLIRSERRPGIMAMPDLPLTIRNLLPTIPVTTNLVEYVKESTQTNNAGPQWSPYSPTAGVQDGALKNKSDLSYTMASAPIRTLAHYMKASRQILSDVPQLQATINQRLLYFLALEEEEEILRGDGTANKLLGIIPQSTAYDTDYNIADDTKIETIRHALLQVTLSLYMPTDVVLHPKDWHDIELTRENNTAKTGAFLMANPAGQLAPRLWGYGVLPTVNMTEGDFLTGNFRLGAAVFDREEASVQIANQNEADFIRNMITILAEERLGLAVYRADAFVEGTFPQ